MHRSVVDALMHLSSPSFGRVFVPLLLSAFGVVYLE